MSTTLNDLIAEAFSCWGMLAEASTKCRLIRRRIRQAKKSGDADIDDLNLDLVRVIAQTRADTHKYSGRIQEIYQELIANGEFSKLGRMENLKRVN